MEDIEWNVYHEGQLLESMIGHKPVGVNRYFQMAFICEKFADIVQKEIDPAKIWAHLGTIYNLEALDEGESIPFPNTEKEFSLPEAEFGGLITKKDEEKKLQKGRETPKKELKKEEKTPMKKEVQRRDSKDSKEKTPIAKKEVKKEPEKNKNKSKNSTPREDKRTKGDDTPKPAKRPTRGSLKPDDSSSSGKSSPIPATPPAPKRRRI